MLTVWVCVVLALIELASGYLMPEDLYFRAPPMFHLDDYERCLHRGGVFCLGEFRLSPGENTCLFQELLEFSSNRYLPNRTQLHRGLCVIPEEGEDPSTLFQKAVDQDMEKNYGLRAKLRQLQYCKSKAAPGTRPIDYTDLLMAAVIAAVLALNVAGTVYDYKRDPAQKPYRFLLAWSLRSNWSRLTAVHSGDERLDGLKFIHGIKAHQGLLVIAAHEALALSVFYIQDSRTIDDLVTDALAAFGKTGTIVTPTFATLTSFLFAYMLLLHVEKTKILPTLKDVPKFILARYFRLTPTIMFMVGVTATWVARAADGPMWYVVQQLEADCRAKWWTHLFFINNLVNKDQRCTVQTWFLAVDMQVFVVAVILTLLLLRRPQAAPRALLAVYAGVVATNLALNIKWQMVPMSTMSTADNLRKLYVGLESYNWCFSMPWTSLPASLHGLLLAFIHYNQQKNGYQPPDNKWFRLAIPCAYMAAFAMMFTGVLFEDVSNPMVLSFVATFKGIVFNALITFILWTLLKKLSGTVESYLSWRGFQVASRIALSTTLVHWHINLAGPAVIKQLLEFDHFQFLVQYLSGTVLTYALALPLHLLVELPTQKVMDIFI